MTPLQRAYHLGHVDGFAKGLKHLQKKEDAWKRVENADKVRLDWWVKQVPGIIAPSFTGRGWFIDLRPKAGVCEKDDLRSAIDYAMRMEKKA